MTHVVVCTAVTGAPDPNYMPAIDTTLHPCETEAAAFEYLMLQMRRFSFGNEHYECRFSSDASRSYFRAENREAHAMFMYEIKKLEAENGEEDRKDDKDDSEED